MASIARKIKRSRKVDLIRRHKKSQRESYLLLKDYAEAYDGRLKLVPNDHPDKKRLVYETAERRARFEQMLQEGMLEEIDPSEGNPDTDFMVPAEITESLVQE